MGSSVAQQPELVPEVRRPAGREAAASLLHYGGALGIVRSISRGRVLADAEGGGRKWQRVSGPRYAVLCYHRIGSGGIPLFSDLPPAVFESQVQFLQRHYRVVSMTKICEEIENPDSAKTGGQTVAITFDDGYKDLYSQALPILKRYGVAATVFLPVASIEKNEPLWYDRIFLLFTIFPGERMEVETDRRRVFALPDQAARIRAAAEVIGWLRTLPEDRRKQECERLEGLAELPEDMLKGRMLTWDQIREMKASGLDFGGHTMTHPVVSRLTQEQLKREIVDSKQILEARIEERVQHFAFPFGKQADCGTEAFSVIAMAGYRSASTTEEGVNGPAGNLLSLKRVSLGEERHLPMFALKMAQLFITAAPPAASESKSQGAEISADAVGVRSGNAQVSQR